MEARTYLSCLALTAALGGCGTLQAGAPDVGLGEAPARTPFAGIPGPPPSGLVTLCLSGRLACAPEAGSVKATAGEARILTSTVPLGATQALALSRARWRTLVQVNALINRSIRAQSDMTLYGVRDYWALPLTQGGGGDVQAQGDCEDYVLEKRQRLLSAGFPAEALSIAIVWSQRLGRHAVLVVRTDQGDWVLDSLQRHPLRAEDAPYEWIAMQTGSSLNSWERLGPLAANLETAATAATVADPRAADLFAVLLAERIAAHSWRPTSPGG